MYNKIFLKVVQYPVLHITIYKRKKITITSLRELYHVKARSKMKHNNLPFTENKGRVRIEKERALVVQKALSEMKDMIKNIKSHG